MGYTEKPWITSLRRMKKGGQCQKKPSILSLFTEKPKALTICNICGTISPTWDFNNWSLDMNIEMRHINELVQELSDVIGTATGISREVAHEYLGRVPSDLDEIPVREDHEIEGFFGFLHTHLTGMIDSVHAVQTNMDALYQEPIPMPTREEYVPKNQVPLPANAPLKGRPLARR
jgi:hypothetical protein